MMHSHCQLCGGFISDPSHISYRFPSNPAHLAMPHNGFCACRLPVVYALPSGTSWSPIKSIRDYRSTSRFVRTCAGR